MFAAMAGEAGCRSYEITAMAAALPVGSTPGSISGWTRARHLQQLVAR